MNTIALFFITSHMNKNAFDEKYQENGYSKSNIRVSFINLPIETQTLLMKMK